MPATFSLSTTPRAWRRNLKKLYKTSRRSGFLAALKRFGLYALAGLALLLLGFDALTLARYPYHGMEYSFHDGSVRFVDPAGPAAGKVQVGDRIATVNGKDIRTTRNLPTWRAGEVLTYAVYSPPRQAGPALQRVRVTLAPPPGYVRWARLSPLLVAACFWLVGILVLAMSQPSRLTKLFFLFCQGFVLTLGVGSLTAYEPAWISLAFRALLWWVAPVVVHTILSFLSPPHPGKARPGILILYFLALIFSLAELTHHPILPAWLPNPAYLWLGLHFCLGMALPLVAMSRAKTPSLRQTASILTVAAWLGLLPLLLFSLVPEVLVERPALPYETTFLALPAIPLGFGYAILRGRLVYLERYINRSAAYALAGLLVGAVYALVYSLAPQLLPGKERRLTVIGLVVTVGLIFVAHPLYLICLRLVQRIFYGDWYDERAAVQQISAALGGAEGDAPGIAQTLCQALQKTMQLQYANLLLRDGALATTSAHSQSNAITYLPSEENERLWTSLEHVAQQEPFSVHDLAARLDASETVRKTVLGGRPQFWLALQGEAGPLGLLILGNRRGSEFDERDLEILEVVVRQAKVALENAELLEEVRHRSEQVRRLHRQVLEAREEERKRVARDLHDQIIQALVGLNYQMANERSGQMPEVAAAFGRVQTRLRGILNDLRQVCADLRPPALDTLGLAPALQSRLAELEGKAPFAIDLQVVGDEEREVPEAVALCLYRVFQEALQNVKKHAGAKRVRVCLEVSADAIRLTVQDDGRGFRLPQHLSVLAQERHFGLVGLRELLESVQGTLEIETAPGKGCRLTADAPLAGAALPVAQSAGGMAR